MEYRFGGRDLDLVPSTPELRVLIVLGVPKVVGLNPAENLDRACRAPAVQEGCSISLGNLDHAVVGEFSAAITVPGRSRPIDQSHPKSACHSRTVTDGRTKVAGTDQRSGDDA
jgi:hypothetical protein